MKSPILEAEEPLSRTVNALKDGVFTFQFILKQIFSTPRTLTATTTPIQSGPGNTGNKRVLHNQKYLLCKSWSQYSNQRV